MKKRQQQTQLSLFETNDIPPVYENYENKNTNNKMTVLEYVRSRFENREDMTQEEYKRWIKILIHNSLRRMD